MTINKRWLWAILTAPSLVGRKATSVCGSKSLSLSYWFRSDFGLFSAFFCYVCLAHLSLCDFSINSAAPEEGKISKTRDRFAWITYALRTYTDWDTHAHPLGTKGHGSTTHTSVCVCVWEYLWINFFHRRRTIQCGFCYCCYYCLLFLLLVLVVDVTTKLSLRWRGRKWQDAQWHSRGSNRANLAVTAACRLSISD